MDSAARSIPACWAHWNLLPEDLRSLIVKSYGRGQITEYSESLLAAVKVWRQVGVWRKRGDETALPVVQPSTRISKNPKPARKVIPLAERRAFAKPGPRRAETKADDASPQWRHGADREAG
jgi:hypothetical protein